MKAGAQPSVQLHRDGTVRPADNNKEAKGLSQPQVSPITEAEENKETEGLMQEEAEEEQEEKEETEGERRKKTCLAFLFNPDWFEQPWLIVHLAPQHFRFSTFFLCLKAFKFGTLTGSCRFPRFFFEEGP